MRIHEQRDLREQMAFISYYFHWSYEEILHLSHIERKAFCEEIMRIHRIQQGESIDLWSVK